MEKKVSVMDRVLTFWTIFVGKYLSLDRMFKRKSAFATIHFVGNEKYGGSIVVNVDGIDYFFECKQKLKTYKNNEGKKITMKKLKYGGWGIDLQAPENKII